jgi:hypothetical protein
LIIDGQGIFEQFVLLWSPITRTWSHEEIKCYNELTRYICDCFREGGVWANSVLGAGLYIGAGLVEKGLIKLLVLWQRLFFV